MACYPAIKFLNTHQKQAVNPVGLDKTSTTHVPSHQFLLFTRCDVKCTVSFIGVFTFVMLVYGNVKLLLLQTDFPTWPNKVSIYMLLSVRTSLFDIGFYLITSSNQSQTHGSSEIFRYQT